MKTNNEKIINVHISEIRPGDTIICPWDNIPKTVCVKDIKNDYGELTIFGVSYRSGTVPVKKVIYTCCPGYIITQPTDTISIFSGTPKECFDYIRHNMHNVESKRSICIRDAKTLSPEYVCLLFPTRAEAEEEGQMLVKHTLVKIAEKKASTPKEKVEIAEKYYCHYFDGEILPNF